ncbi:TolC family protein [Flavobacteriaceae bacterium TK19130]|nr:TolC family protein [Thermobacterium salinum]
MRTLFHIFVSFLLGSTFLLAQEKVLGFEEYMAQVKAFHPVVKQANLQLEMSEASLLEARGGFDPKVEVDYENKEFKGTDYYDNLNTSFKVPTWYGIELKASWEQNSGEFLNPQNVVPEDGLYSAGVSLSLKEGFLLTKRMATVRKAKLFIQQTQAERDILVNAILHDAAIAYIDWLQAFKERSVYETFLTNAEDRFQGIKKQAEVGEMAAIDSTEAKITFQNRQLSLEAARLAYRKAALEVSNYLWLSNTIPVELQQDVTPVPVAPSEMDRVLALSGLALNDIDITNHPKIQAVQRKVDQLQLDTRLKRNLLLPDVSAYYNFLTTTPEVANSFVNDNLKAGLQLSVPIFLRKERGALQLAKAKEQDGEFTLENEKLQLRNKLDAAFTAVQSYSDQYDVIQDIVTNYETLWEAEIRKFDLGESSLFLVISRENRFIDARLKEIDLENKWFRAKLDLFRTTVQNPDAIP